MSSIALAGSSSGSGKFTVTPPAGANVDRTFTLPDRSGNITVDGPVFSVYQSAASQSISANTWTTVVLDAEETDSNGFFNNTGSTVGGIPAYSFKPTVAGWYLFAGEAQTTGDLGQIFCAIFRNGAEHKRGTVSGTATNAGRATTVTCAALLNGSTDYIDFRFNVTGTSCALQNSSGYTTWFQGIFLRAP